MINKVTLISFLVFTSTGIAYSQTYTPLSPNSNLNCVYLPNGDTQIAYENSQGYKSTGFGAAKKKAVKNISAIRKKTRQVAALKRKFSKLKSKGTFEIKISSKEFKKVQKFIAKGEIDASSPSISVNENLAVLDGLQASYNLQIEYEKELIKLIKKCKERVIPPFGTLDTRFVNIVEQPYSPSSDSSGQGYVAVFAVVPSYIGQIYPYCCFKHPLGSALYKKVTLDPCFQEGLSNRDPETCDNLIEYDSKGYPLYYLALLQKRNFYFKNRAGAVN
ncbi:MAG: hypothetical protein KDD62_11475, partial [Bdellovibrionales bacterium]|nr:hypothetical protein [Bdellovibrionales bacterium]